jgi:hypothetical protein
LVESSNILDSLLIPRLHTASQSLVVSGSKQSSKSYRQNIKAGLPGKLICPARMRTIQTGQIVTDQGPRHLCFPLAYPDIECALLKLFRYSRDQNVKVFILVIIISLRKRISLFSSVQV